MLLVTLVDVSDAVAATRSRSRKTELLAELFLAAGPEDAPLAIAYLSGRVPQGRIGVGWSTLRDAPAPAAAPSLTLHDVDAALAGLAAVAGKGAQAERRRRAAALLGAATETEQRFLVGLLTGEVRQGALDAMAAEGLAAASGVPAEEVRRAVMLRGALVPVARALLAEGRAALGAFRLTVGRPVRPMLAATAGSVAEALAALGSCAVEEKLDGIRVQVHRDGERVSVWTRTLEDITERLPEVVEVARALPVERCVLDGEVIAYDEAGRPRTFQEIAGRTGSRTDVAKARALVPVVPVFFDVLLVGEQELLDAPFARRHRELAALVGEEHRVRRYVAEESGAGPGAPPAADVLAGGEDFLAETLKRGHEGVVVKDLDAPYSAGRRGAAWRKVKPVHTLDLVVLAAEWGHGRRTGKLSNLHLGARGEDGELVMLGKTFKGLTDAMLAEQTERLLELAVSDDGHTVRVRPGLVVEIAFDGVQRSSRYPAGLTLRFARVIRYRPDKTPQEADTVEAVREAGAGAV
ncbi:MULTISPECIES: ATP-dependent DNA ligase [unclassified Streptomyces]|uniref:ATP-dependent DNA ligase n=1 Tax=unclassified Streptomyces TaxID=2593676 RepID=UPI0004C8DC18|nr:ATP-dependent DNA ligase [Streptomyces sp. NRRL F-5630]